MDRLRSPLLSRLVASLALAGLLVPLAPAASAAAPTAERLTEVLGHGEAVEMALEAARGAADPEAAFLDAYREATGQDAESVLARLQGEALWMLADAADPVAVLVAAASGGFALSAPATGVLLTSPEADRAVAPAAAPAPEVPEASEAPLPRALQPRAP